jgi:hypothetical protein
MTDEVLPYSRSTQQRERDALRAAQSRGTVIPPDDDTLRTRIAAVQQAHHLRIDPNHPAYGYCMCGYNPDADEDDYWWVAHAKHVADAVIRDLGLHQTTGGQYSTRVELSDAELDNAGFTYHRKGATDD